VSGKSNAATILPPKKEPIEREAEWAQEPFWTFWRREKSFVRARFRTPGCPVVSLGTVPTTLFPMLRSCRRQSLLACALMSERTHLRRSVHVNACVHPCFYQNGHNKQCKPRKLASSLYLLSAWLESGTGTQIVPSLGILSLSNSQRVCGWYLALNHDHFL
jgi:hypothetical protein